MYKFGNTLQGFIKKWLLCCSLNRKQITYLRRKKRESKELRPWPNKKLRKAATILCSLFGQAESYFFGRIVRLPFFNKCHFTIVRLTLNIMNFNLKMIFVILDRFPPSIPPRGVVVISLLFNFLRKGKYRLLEQRRKFPTPSRQAQADVMRETIRTYPKGNEGEMLFSRALGGLQHGLLTHFFIFCVLVVSRSRFLNTEAFTNFKVKLQVIFTQNFTQKEN